MKPCCKNRFFAITAILVIVLSAGTVFVTYNLANKKTIPSNHYIVLKPENCQYGVKAAVCNGKIVFHDTRFLREGLYEMERSGTAARLLMQSRRIISLSAENTDLTCLYTRPIGLKYHVILCNLSDNKYMGESYDIGTSAVNVYRANHQIMIYDPSRASIWAKNGLLSEDPIPSDRLAVIPKSDESFIYDKQWQYPVNYHRIFTYEPESPNTKETDVLLYYDDNRTIFLSENMVCIQTGATVQKYPIENSDESRFEYGFYFNETIYLLGRKYDSNKRIVGETVIGFSLESKDVFSQYRFDNGQRVLQITKDTVYYLDKGTIYQKNADMTKQIHTIKHHKSSNIYLVDSAAHWLFIYRIENGHSEKLIEAVDLLSDRTMEF